MSDTLTTLIDNCRYEIGHIAATVATGHANTVILLLDAAMQHRLLASALLLEEDDRLGFRHHLRCAAQAWLVGVARHRAGAPCPDRHLVGADWVHITSALAAGDRGLALDQLAVFPQVVKPDLEYAEDHLHNLTLAQLARPDADAKEVSKLCARWEEALDGAKPGALPACRAILAGDADGFADAMSSLTDERQASRKRLLKDVVPPPADQMATEWRLHLDGLALLTLARLRGLKVRQRAPAGCPLVAQFSDPPSPLPSDAWTRSTR